MSEDNNSSNDFNSDQTFSAGDDVVSAPQGFFERLSNSFGAIVMGLVLIPLACWGLFWNEGRAVKTARALTEGAGIVQSVGTARVDPAFNGKLVHVSGEATSAGGVADETFGVKTSGLKLARHVEMYQWVEKESGSGQDRKFTYSREWKDRHIDSGRFKFPQGHVNPADLPYKASTFIAKDARIGAYPLGGAVGALGATREFRADESGLAKARAQTPHRVQVVDGVYYIGLDPARPAIADTRVSYRIVPEGSASFVGRQAAGGLESYRASNGNEFLLAQTGSHPPDEMFAKAQDDNATMTWILRGVGLLALFMGFSALFSPVQLLASYIPILGSLVSGAIWLVAATATAIVGPVVIALAWFAYRPLVAVGVLALGAAAAYGFRQLRLRRQSRAALGRFLPVG